jgi:hypothetical protein
MGPAQMNSDADPIWERAMTTRANPCQISHCQVTTQTMPVYVPQSPSTFNLRYPSLCIHPQHGRVGTHDQGQIWRPQDRVTITGQIYGRRRARKVSRSQVRPRRQQSQR